MSQREKGLPHSKAAYYKKYPKRKPESKPARPVGHVELRRVIIEPRHAIHWPEEFDVRDFPFPESSVHRQETRMSRRHHIPRPPLPVFQPPVPGA